MLTLVVAGCNTPSGSSPDDLAAKERELQAKEQALKEQSLAAREQAVSAREQGAPANGAPSAPAPRAATSPHSAALPSTVVPPAAPSTAPASQKVRVTVSLTVDMTKPGGAQWDAAGDAPDPVISLSVPRTGFSSRGPKTPNSLVSTSSFEVDLQAGDSVTVAAVDSDVAADDPIGNFSAAYAGRATSVSGRMGAAAVSVSFLPL